MTAIPLEREVYYPESDGQPMAETQFHLDEMVYLLKAFEERFRQAAEVFVAANLFFYFERGNPRACVAPDLFIVPGVRKGKRRTYRLWEEGQVPCLVVEVTSDSTEDEDLTKKKGIYERLGVAEYFLFDPLGDYIPERLAGFRLSDGRYRPLPVKQGTLTSETTGVTFKVEGNQLRLLDAGTGRVFLRPEEYPARLAEEATARRQAEQAQKAAEARADAAEAELARLKGLLAP